MIPVVLIAKNDADCNIETRPFPSEYLFYVKMTTPATDFICKAQHDLRLSLASLIIHVSIILKDPNFKDIATSFLRRPESSGLHAKLLCCFAGYRPASV
jgi:hypothetical protein